MKLINNAGRVVEIDPRYEAYFLKQGFKKVEEKAAKEEKPKRGRKPKGEK